MVSYKEDKREILTRLRRIEGQLRGIQRMVEADKYCIDVLTQISSVIAAARHVGIIVLRDHINGCVRKALGDGQDGDEAVNELLQAVNRLSRAWERPKMSRLTWQDSFNVAPWGIGSLLV